MEVYELIGCTKQNVSYWSLHSYSTQARKSIFKVIENAKKLFALQEHEAEALANSAGLSLKFESGYIIDVLGYKGKLKTLCDKAIISERMLRRYKTETPTKQAILAQCLVMNKPLDEINLILNRYGYCLSDSIVADVVVKWHIFRSENRHNGEMLIFDINEVIAKMGLPMIMTRQN